MIYIIYIYINMFSGYDSWTYDNDSWDTDYYAETNKMYNIKSSMQNKIESLTDDTQQQTDSGCVKMLSEAEYAFNEMQKKAIDLKNILVDKINDNYYLKNQVFILYILIFISIIIIISQKSTINNLKQLIYILQMGSTRQINAQI